MLKKPNGNYTGIMCLQDHVDSTNLEKKERCWLIETKKKQMVDRHARLCTVLYCLPVCLIDLIAEYELFYCWDGRHATSTDVATMVSALLNYVHASFEVHHVSATVEGRRSDYYQGKTMWYDDPAKDRRGDNDLPACRGYSYSTCDIAAEERHEVDEDSIIEYHLSWETKQITLPDLLTFIGFGTIKPDCQQCLGAANLFEQLERAGDTHSNADSVYFQLDLPLLLRYGHFNEDHRGSDHLRILLDFPHQIELPSFFTLKDLAESVFRLKSHKFDTFYEMFTAMDLLQSDNCYIGDLCYDHGS